MARKLKGMAKWQGVSTSHDLTKMECMEERNKELILKQEAESKNAVLSELEKHSKFWKVIGGRGRRRVVLITME